MENWLIQHIVPAFSAATVLAAGAGWTARHLGFLAGTVADEVAAIDSDVLGRVHSPVVKQFLIDVEVAADKAIPGAGDAKYAALTALIVHDLPRSAAVIEGPLEVVLTAIGSGAKAGLQKAVSVPPVPVTPAA